MGVSLHPRHVLYTWNHVSPTWISQVATLQRSRVINLIDNVITPGTFFVELLVGKNAPSYTVSSMKLPNMSTHLHKRSTETAHMIVQKEIVPWYRQTWYDTKTHGLGGVRIQKNTEITSSKLQYVKTSKRLPLINGVVTPISGVITPGVPGKPIYWVCNSV